MLLELDKVKTVGDRRKEVLSWRKELAEARSAHLLTARAPQTARALKPLSVHAASEREVRRPSRCAVRPAARGPAVARPATSDAEAAALQQRNTALEMAVLALGEAFEASGGSPTASLQAAMDRLHAAGGVNISSGADSYVPFSPAQLSTQAHRASTTPYRAYRAADETTTPAAQKPPSPTEPGWLVDAAATLAIDDGGDDDATTTTTPAARYGRQGRSPSPATPQSGAPDQKPPSPKEPGWLVDAAATLAKNSTRDPSLAKPVP